MTLLSITTTAHNEEKSIENDRDNALYDVLEREKDQKKYHTMKHPHGIL